MTTLRSNTVVRKRFQNPIQRRFEKHAHKYENAQLSDRATYKGIGIKCGFFALFLLVGIALSKVLSSAHVLGTLASVFNVQSGFIMFISVVAGFVLMLISSILAGRGKTMTIIFGSLFCTSIGFMLTNSASLSTKYSNHIMLALIITVGIFLALFVSFTSGMIKVTDKFKSIVFTIFMGMIFSTVLVFISTFIPATHNIGTFILNNSLIGIGFSAVYLVIACCYLIFSFDGVKKLVDQGMHKDAEWTGAFSIVFSLIWIFIEVLSILNKVNR